MRRAAAAMVACALLLTGAVGFGDDPYGQEPVRVEGVSSPDGARLLSADPGYYVGKVPDPGSTEFYQVERRIERSYLYVGVATHPTEPQTGRLNIALHTLGGPGEEPIECHAETTGDQPVPGIFLLSATALGYDQVRRSTCQGADKFLLTVDAEGWYPGTTGGPMEITVAELPPVDADAGVAGPAPAVRWSTMPGTSGTEAAEGGEGIGGAPPLPEGAYHTSLGLGEIRWFRVDLDWGQSLQAHLRMEPLTGPSADRLSSDPPAIALQVVGPTFGGASILSEDLGRDAWEAELDPDAGLELGVATRKVMYKNATGLSHDLLSTAIAGPYYVGVSTSPPSGTTGTSDGTGASDLDFTLQLAVLGAPDDPPEFRGADRPLGAAWPTPTPIDLDLLLLGGGGLALFVGGAVTIVTLRRGRHPSS